MNRAAGAKGRVEDLAICGGTPLFVNPLHVGRPAVLNRQAVLDRIAAVLDSGIFTNDGPAVRELEARLAAFFDVEHVIAFCNGTAALEAAVRVAGLEGEVLVPSFTFVATAHALTAHGIRPVFCDIDPRTHNVDPSRLEELITPRTNGILGVHVWGRPCDTEALASIAGRHGLTLLFDAAHAFGCSHRGKMIGGFGCAEVFSFHATKVFQTFEGGAIATNDGRLAQAARLLRNFGFAGYDRVIEVGTNGKMTEVSAAMGLAGLEAFPSVLSINARHHAAYRHRLNNVPGLSVARYDETERCNYQYVVVEVNQAEAGMTRDQLVQILWAENVLARRYFYPGCHRMEPYRTRWPVAPGSLPATERLAERVMALPTGPAVADDDVQQVCELIAFIVTNASRVGSLTT